MNIVNEDASEEQRFQGDSLPFQRCAELSRDFQFPFYVISALFHVIPVLI